MHLSQSTFHKATQKIIGHMTATILKDFMKCNNDDDRINFIHHHHSIDDLLVVRPMFDGKSAEESKKCREKGNIYYQKQEHKLALEWYSKSVIWAPHPCSILRENTPIGNDELALAFGNRSATLYQLKRFEECLSDIKLAFQNHFPIHIQYKLYDRMGRCLMELGDLDSAIESFAYVKDVLHYSRLDSNMIDRIIVNTDRQIVQCKTEGDVLENGHWSYNKHAVKSIRPVELNTPQIAQDYKNKHFPCASSQLDVTYSPQKGRHTISHLNVSVGTFILIEKPYSSVLDTAYYLTRCFHCFKVLVLEPIPCLQCIAVRYCSEVCRHNSWNFYHQYECNYLGLINSLGTSVVAHLAMRTVLTAGLPQVLKCKRSRKADTADAQKTLFTDARGVYLDGFASVYNLLAHSRARSGNDLVQYGILAIFLTKVLRQTGFLQMPGEKEADLITEVGGVILRFLQIVACNGMEVIEMVRGTSLLKCKSVPIGMCLYPTCSLINHSCNPAMELIFYNNYVAARAIRNVMAGEELTINYGCIFYVTPKEQRQMYLQSQYFFICTCEACKMQWPIKVELKSDIPILKCIECFMPLSLGGASKNPTKVECRKCKLKQNPLEYIEALRMSSHVFEKALDRARYFEIKNTLPVLEDHLIVMDTHLHQPWKEYTICVSTIKHCYRLEGNVKKNTMDANEEIDDFYY